MPDRLRYARLYSDGSFNVSSVGDDLERATALLNGSSDDADTQMVQVNIRIVQTFGSPKLRIVKPTDALREALEQALDCILGETPEDCTPEEAREDTLEKIRTALQQLEVSP